MNVQETIDLGNGHLIEIGIPMNDLGPLVAAVARRDILDPSTTAELIETLAASLARQLNTSSPPSLSSLLERVTDENRHGEVETGPAVGNEAW